jgi:hypothetical protein
VIAIHSDVRALVDNTRNLSDAELDGAVYVIMPRGDYNFSSWRYLF